MARIAPMLLVVALVVGTATAFGITERLKLEPSPIVAVRVDKVFSPVCRCERDEAEIAVRLRDADRLTLSIVDDEDDGDVVRTLFASRPTARGLIRTRWDGRGDDGRLLAEASYWPQLHFDEQRRTIVLPNPIRVDVTDPRIVLAKLTPPAFSPDGDGRNDKLAAFYRVDEPAHALLFVDGVRRVRSRAQRLEGKLEWFGVVDRRSVRRGTYAVTLAAEDLAGNVSEPTRPVTARVRYVELARDAIGVRARVRFGVRVETDATSYRWRFAGRTGVARGRLLVLRAPRAGRYRLFVAANGHADAARVIVAPRTRTR